MYNSTGELHIGVDIALQLLNSNRKQVIKPEEKDWFLNNTMLQVINNHIDPNSTMKLRGSDSDQRSVDYLNELKVSLKYKQPVMVDDTGNKYSIALPSNYYRKSRFNANISFNIKEDKNSIVKKNNDRLRVGVVPFDLLALNPDLGGATVTLDDYLNTTKITVNTKEVFNADDRLFTNKDLKAYDFSNIKSELSRFMMITTMLEAMNSKAWLSVYWESYRGTFNKNSFIFVVDSDAYAKYNVTALNDDSDVVMTVGSATYAKSLSLLTGVIIEGGYNKTVKGRIVESEESDAINDNSFFDSSAHSLSAVIEGGELVVTGSKDFKITDIDLVYYRKPRLINYKTNQNCEITSSDFVSQLVSLTAQKINAFLDNENYQQVVNENIMLL